MKFVKSLAATLALSGAMFSVYGGGIPVIDGAHISATVQGNAEQIAKWAIQLNDMKTQIEKQSGIWSTLKDGRGMGNILNKDLATQFLPKDYQAVVEAIRNGKGDWNGISGSIADIVKANQLKSCAELNTDKVLRAKCESQWKSTAISKKLGDIGFKKATENIDNLQTYIQSINVSKDQKAISEISARIQVETVRMQNEEMKLRTIAMMEKADQKLATQRAYNQFETSLKSLERPSF